MQAAKDTFYVALRDGIVGANAQRVIVVRGVLRPAVLVAENELPTNVNPLDAFRLQWTEVNRDSSGTVPLAKLRCEIWYETAGSALNGGMDRGRALTAMDEELVEALCGPEQNAAKMDFSSGTPVPTGTQIFWSDPVFSAAVSTGERVSRIAVVDVWSYEESGQA